MAKVRITMTDHQQKWLLDRLQLDWDEEVRYQEQCGETDTSYLEELLDCYEAISGKADNFIGALVIADDIDYKKKEIERLKNLNNL